GQCQRRCRDPVRGLRPVLRLRHRACLPRGRVVTVPSGIRLAHFLGESTTGRGQGMDTAPETAMPRRSRLPAQALAGAALACAVAAFLWDAGLASLLLAWTGVRLARVAVALSPDGWLIDDSQEAPR